MPATLSAAPERSTPESASHPLTSPQSGAAPSIREVFVEAAEAALSGDLLRWFDARVELARLADAHPELAGRIGRARGELDKTRDIARKTLRNAYIDGVLAEREAK